MRIYMREYMRIPIHLLLSCKFSEVLLQVARLFAEVTRQLLLRVPFLMPNCESFSSIVTSFPFIFPSSCNNLSMTISIFGTASEFASRAVTNMY